MTFNDGVGGPTGKGSSDLHEDDRKPSVVVWDILTMQKKRTFQPSEEITWPMFKWSHDDKYFARQTEDNIQIYETPSCGLLDKKSHKVTNDVSGSETIHICILFVHSDFRERFNEYCSRHGDLFLIKLNSFSLFSR